MLSLKSLNKLERCCDIEKVNGKVLVNRCIVKASLGQVRVVKFGKTVSTAAPMYICWYKLPLNILLATV